MDTDWRVLTAAQRGLIERLLAVEFPGREKIASQLTGCSARQIDGDGSLVFQDRCSEFASVKRRIPIEAQAPDVDGVLVHALLHVVDGLATELEIYKEDGSAVVKFPEPQSWEIVDLG